MNWNKIKYILEDISYFTKRNPLVLLFMGFLFMGFGFYYWHSKIMLFMGIFFLFGFYILSNSKPQNNEKATARPIDIKELK